MPNISETDRMENMLGTTQKESTEGRRSKGALLASEIPYPLKYMEKTGENREFFIYFYPPLKRILRDHLKRWWVFFIYV
jgi:hypothetical protein